MHSQGWNYPKQTCRIRQYRGNPLAGGELPSQQNPNDRASGYRGLIRAITDTITSTHIAGPISHRATPVATLSPSAPLSGVAAGSDPPSSPDRSPHSARSGFDIARGLVLPRFGDDVRCAGSENLPRGFDASFLARPGADDSASPAINDNAGHVPARLVKPSHTSSAKQTIDEAFIAGACFVTALALIVVAAAMNWMT